MAKDCKSNCYCNIHWLPQSKLTQNLIGRTDHSFFSLTRFLLIGTFSYCNCLRTKVPSTSC